MIFLFMEGGPSHIDLFDPKPLVNRLDGEPIPPGFKGHLQAMTGGRGGLADHGLAQALEAARREWPLGLGLAAGDRRAAPTSSR